jgi:GxxExxY protein
VLQILGVDELEDLIQKTLDCGMQMHREIGPGLLESVYENILGDRLTRQGIRVDRQQPVDIRIDGSIYPNAFRYDLLLNNSLLLEIKSLEKLGPIHIKQTLTYIRLMNLPFGLLLNFGGETFKEGIRRVINPKPKA